MDATTLEQALLDLEAKLAIAAKSAAAASGLLKKAQTSAKVGLVRDLSKNLVEARIAAKRYAEEIADADSAWRFDAEAHLASGEYLDELKDEAARADLQLFERDNRIYCFPMLLTLSDKDLAVLIDRKPERRIRPRELVKILLARQNRPQRFNGAKLLESLFEAYTHLGPRISPNWTLKTSGPGPVVPLVEIHALLTLLPGSDRDYPKEEFARDIHLLDRQPDLRTKDGRSFALPAATGTKGNQRLTVIDEQGSEKIYVGIRFDKE